MCRPSERYILKSIDDILQTWKLLSPLLFICCRWWFHTVLFLKQGKLVIGKRMNCLSLGKVSKVMIGRFGYPFSNLSNIVGRNNLSRPHFYHHLFRDVSSLDFLSQWKNIFKLFSFSQEPINVTASTNTMLFRCQITRNKGQGIDAWMINEHIELQAIPLKTWRSHPKADSFVTWFVFFVCYKCVKAHLYMAMDATFVLLLSLSVLFTLFFWNRTQTHSTQERQNETVNPLTLTWRTLWDPQHISQKTGVSSNSDHFHCGPHRASRRNCYIFRESLLFTRASTLVPPPFGGPVVCWSVVRKHRIAPQSCSFGRSFNWHHLVPFRL